MDELGFIVKQKLENAQHASLLAAWNAESSQTGAQAMAKVSASMDAIARSGHSSPGWNIIPSDEFLPLPVP